MADTGTHVSDRLRLISEGERAATRLQLLVARLTSAQTTGMWRLAADGRHVADVVIADGRICYVVLHGATGPTLGELMARREPERASYIREVLETAAARGQRLGETLAIVGGFDADFIRDCLRDQVAERLATLARVNHRISGQWLALNGSFDTALTFGGEEAYAAARDQIAARVLFVDDDPNILRAIARVTSNWPIAVDCAPSAEAARALASRGAYDIIVVDYVLEDANGAELSAMMRDSQPGASFVLASGMIDEQALRDVAMRHGIQGVLPKPFDSRLLRALLQKDKRACSI